MGQEIRGKNGDYKSQPAITDSSHLNKSIECSPPQPPFTPQAGGREFSHTVLGISPNNNCKDKTKYCLDSGSIASCPILMKATHSFVHFFFCGRPCSCIFAVAAPATAPWPVCPLLCCGDQKVEISPFQPPVPVP